MTLAGVILLFVTLERLAELWLSARNTAIQRANGACEHAAGHYPFIVALHGAWLAGLWLLARDAQVDLRWLALFALLQVLRVWVIAALGRRWTTRIIILPGAPLVSTGPYRLVRHPNYLVVVGEIAVLPLVFSMPLYALVFSLLNGIVLAIRIRAEERAINAAGDTT
jgi:methyltransferase